MVHLHKCLRWQISPGTSEAESLDEASVPEKETQWPNSPRAKRINSSLTVVALIEEMEIMILGTGIDIIEVDRIQKAVERWGDVFLNYVFTPWEIGYARKFKFPYRYYAGRFAVKEAIFKAMGNPDLSWHDVTITNDSSGKPVCRFNKINFKHRLLISISHNRDYAIASAIVEK